MKGASARDTIDCDSSISPFFSLVLQERDDHDQINTSEKVRSAAPARIELQTGEEHVIERGVKGGIFNGRTQINLLLLSKPHCRLAVLSTAASESSSSTAAEQTLECSSTATPTPRLEITDLSTNGVSLNNKILKKGQATQVSLGDKIHLFRPGPNVDERTKEMMLLYKVERSFFSETKADTTRSRVIPECTEVHSKRRREATFLPVQEDEEDMPTGGSKETTPTMTERNNTAPEATEIQAPVEKDDENVDEEESEALFWVPCRRTRQHRQEQQSLGSQQQEHRQRPTWKISTASTAITTTSSSNIEMKCDDVSLFLAKTSMTSFGSPPPSLPSSPSFCSQSLAQHNSPPVLSQLASGPSQSPLRLPSSPVPTLSLKPSVAFLPLNQPEQAGEASSLREAAHVPLVTPQATSSSVVRRNTTSDTVLGSVHTSGGGAYSSTSEFKDLFESQDSVRGSCPLFLPSSALSASSSSSTSAPPPPPPSSASASASEAAAAAAAAASLPSSSFSSSPSSRKVIKKRRRLGSSAALFFSSDEDEDDAISSDHDADDGDANNKLTAPSPNRNRRPTSSDQTNGSLKPLAAEEAAATETIPPPATTSGSPFNLQLPFPSLTQPLPASLIPIHNSNKAVERGSKQESIIAEPTVAPEVVGGTTAMMAMLYEGEEDACLENHDKQLVLAETTEITAEARKVTPMVAQDDPSGLQRLEDQKSEGRETNHAPPQVPLPTYTPTKLTSSSSLRLSSSSSSSFQPLPWSTASKVIATSFSSISSSASSSILSSSPSSSSSFRAPSSPLTLVVPSRLASPSIPTERCLTEKKSAPQIIHPTNDVSEAARLQIEAPAKIIPAATARTVRVAMPSLGTYGNNIPPKVAAEALVAALKGWNKTDSSAPSQLPSTEASSTVTATSVSKIAKSTSSSISFLVEAMHSSTPSSSALVVSGHGGGVCHLSVLLCEHQDTPMSVEPLLACAAADGETSDRYNFLSIEDKVVPAEATLAEIRSCDHNNITTVLVDAMQKPNVSEKQNEIEKIEYEGNVRVEMLEVDKQAAVAGEDYGRAQQIKEEMELIKNEVSEAIVAAQAEIHAAAAAAVEASIVAALENIAVTAAKEISEIESELARKLSEMEATKIECVEVEDYGKALEIKNEIHRLMEQAKYDISQVRSRAEAETSVAASATATETAEAASREILPHVGVHHNGSHSRSGCVDVLVVECNWRLAPKANRLSAALHNACEHVTKEMQDPEERANQSHGRNNPPPSLQLLPTAVHAGALLGHTAAEVEHCYPIKVPHWCVLAKSPSGGAEVDGGGLTSTKDQAESSVPASVSSNNAVNNDSRDITTTDETILRPKWVLYVRPPNLNAGRGDVVTPVEGVTAEDAARLALERTYRNVFNTVAILYARDEIDCGSDISSISKIEDSCRGSDDFFERSSRFGLYHHPGKAQASADWRRALWRFMPIGEQVDKGARELAVSSSSPLPKKTKSAEVFYEDEDVVVVYDGFPKARVHLLIIPKRSCVDAATPSELTPAALPGLIRVHALANDLKHHLEQLAACIATRPNPHGSCHNGIEESTIAATLGSNGCMRNLLLGGLVPLRLGYHASPSLEPLHLHLISGDFDSPCLKHKKHWNSFQPPFFVSPVDIEAALNNQAASSYLTPVETNSTSMADLLPPSRSTSRTDAGRGNERTGGAQRVTSIATERRFRTILEAPLRCAESSLCRCSKSFANLPALRAHLAKALEKCERRLKLRHTDKQCSFPVQDAAADFSTTKTAKAAPSGRP